MKDARKRLMSILQELIQSEQVLQRHMRNEDGRAPDQLEDWMHVVENDEIVEALDNRTLEKIRLVLAALDRVDRGTYGYSVKSGEPIEPERLKAIPWATLTIEEARQEEGAGQRPVHRGASLDKAQPLEKGEPPGMSPGPTGSRDQG